VASWAGASALVADPVMAAIERRRRPYDACITVWSQTPVLALHDRRRRSPVRGPSSNTWSSGNKGAQRRLRLPADTAALAASGRRKAGSLMTANRLLLVAIAELAFAGAAHAQGTDSHFASMGEQGFRRFAFLCRDQKAACDAAFRFGALVGADAAMRCALADDRIACFKKTMNSQEFMEEERKAITGQTDPKQ
jgi:hypothetical protein